jgi:hypothetical protein
MDVLALALSIFCLISSVIYFIYGIRRIQGRFFYSISEVIILFYIRLFKGKKAFFDGKKRLFSNRRLNLIIGIGTLFGIPLLLLFSYIFFLMALQK